MNNPARRTRPERTGVFAPLGDLEQAIMRRVWDSGTTGVLGSDVQADLDRERSIAITTVLTTLDRLREKHIVRRERDGKAFRYWAVVSEEVLQNRIVGGVLDRLIAQFPSAVAAYFAQPSPADSQVEHNALNDLAKKLEHLKAVSSETDEHDS